MGQAIVYCSNCSAQLRGSDFDARKAFKVDDLNFCLKCYQEVVGSAPPPPPSLPTASTKNRIPVPTKSAHSTTGIPIAPPPQVESGNGTLYGILGAVGVVIFLLMAFAMSGGSSRPAPAPSAPERPPVVIPTPAPAPAVSSREASAQEALAKALRTENLEARRALLA